MRNLSLTVKLWLAFSLVSLLLYLVVLLFVPSITRNFFTSTLGEPPVPSPKKDVNKEPLPSFLQIRDFHIRGFIILEDTTTIPSRVRQFLPPSLLQEIKQNAASQQSPRKLYESTNGEIHFRYGIQKDTAYGRPLYQVTFLRKSEEDKFVRSILLRMMLYSGIALLLSWLASLLLARYLARPLIRMQKHVKRIANRNWHEPLNVKQEDEIGQLGHSIEIMRQHLVRQDETQQSMLQNISHELKTPVMVIRSYARAMQDGIYPQGGLAGSVRVIDEEGERLEKLIKQLLYLTRLDYLANKNPVSEKINLDHLMEKITERMKFQRPKIKWKLNLHPITINGDEDTLRVMFENLLDNHLRHAVSLLEISLYVNNKSEIVLCFYNDGSKIEPHVLEQLYQPFHKGMKGKHGLGLTIVQRILQIYQGQIYINNEKGGVSSTVTIPIDE